MGIQVVQAAGAESKNMIIYKQAAQPCFNFGVRKFFINLKHNFYGHILGNSIYYFASSTRKRC